MKKLRSRDTAERRVWARLRIEPVLQKAGVAFAKVRVVRDDEVGVEMPSYYGHVHLYLPRKWPTMVAMVGTPVIQLRNGRFLVLSARRVVADLWRCELTNVNSSGLVTETIVALVGGSYGCGDWIHEAMDDAQAACAERLAGEAK